MQVAGQALSQVREQRNAEIALSIGKIRAIEQEQGVSRESLDDIKAVMLELAAKKDLFPEEDFPPEANEKGYFPVYRLSEDADRRFALYMSTSIGAKDVPPHDHTTWAVIAGVQGEEENRFYDRTDGGTGPGDGVVKHVGGETVRPGVGVTLMPEDIHSIHPRNERPSLHLHMYGMSLENLPNRLVFNTEQGTCKVFPPSPNIVEAR
jgi:predicted metal-dependent enzyme (double-stranded beta helix superfamily)